MAPLLSTVPPWGASDSGSEPQADRAQPRHHADVQVTSGLASHPVVAAVAAAHHAWARRHQPWLLKDGDR